MPLTLGSLLMTFGPMLAQGFASQQQQNQLMQMLNETGAMEDQARTRQEARQLMRGEGIPEERRQEMWDLARARINQEAERGERQLAEQFAERGIHGSGIHGQSQHQLERARMDSLTRAEGDIQAQHDQLAHQQRLAGGQMLDQTSRWQQALAQQMGQVSGGGWGEALATGLAGLVQSEMGDVNIGDWLRGFFAEQEPAPSGTVEQTTPGTGATRTTGAPDAGGTAPTWGGIWPQATAGAGARTAGVMPGGQPLVPHMVPTPGWHHYNPYMRMG